MAVGSDAELTQEIARLREELARRERESAARQLQLDRYAKDLRETFKEERARSKELVRVLCNAVEARDAYTGKHAERVTEYGLEIARTMAIPVTPDLEFGFLLHDIGKLKISDEILFKPSPLTEAEREDMRRHPVTGAHIIHGIGFLARAAAIIRSHHERWDGSGYPDGLAGEEIPLAARVFAVADVFDALTTDRPYRPASSIGEARAMIAAEAGRHFDPRVVEAFESIDEQVLERIRAASQ